MVAARWPGCPEACGLLLVQGLNPCHLHWQVEAWLLDHQGSLLLFLNSRVLKARGSPRLPPAPVFSSACLEAVLPTPGCLNFGAGWAWWVWVATSLSSLPLDLLSPACLPASFPGGSVVKNPPAKAGDAGLIPGSGRIPWRRKWQPTPVSLPGESHGRRAWWATVHGVPKSQTRLSN